MLLHSFAKLKTPAIDSQKKKKTPAIIPPKKKHLLSHLANFFF